MCTKTPKAPPVQNPPSRDSAAGAVQDQARKLRQQAGIENNIFTTPLGDTNYNKNTFKLAKLGSGGNSGAFNGGSPANSGRGSASTGLY